MLSQSLAKLTGAKMLGVMISPITAVLVIGGVLIWQQNKQHKQLLQQLISKPKPHNIKPAQAVIAKTVLPKQQQSNNPRTAMFKQIMDDNIALRSL